MSSIDEFVETGNASSSTAYGQRFRCWSSRTCRTGPRPTIDVRDLLAGKGPNADQPWAAKDDTGAIDQNPLAYLDKWFTAYICERRDTPALDILTELAAQRLPTGRCPRSSTWSGLPRSCSSPVTRPRPDCSPAR